MLAIFFFSSNPTKYLKGFMVSKVNSNRKRPEGLIRKHSRKVIISSVTQYIYISNNVELNCGQHVSVTQDHLQALVNTLLTLKQSYM
jgi:hypothetical protein